MRDLLQRHSSLSHVLSAAELAELATFCSVVTFLPGVSVCAAGDVGRDLYIIAEGAISMFVDEELWCEKRVGDCIAMSVRYPDERGALLAGAPANSPNGARSAAASSAASKLDKPGASWGKCMAVSTVSTRLVQLTRDRWVEFHASHPYAAERAYPLLVEPSASLAGLKFFRGIHSRMLRDISLMFHTVSLRAGEVLFEELSEGNSLFIVSSGRCEAVVRQPDGSEKKLKEFRTHDILGEIAVMMRVPRTATVRATSDCTLLELNRDNFTRFVKLVPATGNIHSIMKSRTAEHFRKYRVPFFSSIPEDKYIILANLCKIETIPAGHVVFKEGDRGQDFYIIAHGTGRQSRETR